MAPNLYHVYSGLLSALGNNSGVRSSLGSPPRIYTRVPETSNVFPFMVVQGTPQPVFGGGKGGGSWVHQVGLEFYIYDNSTSLVTAAAALKAVMDAMDRIHTTISIAGCECLQSIPLSSFLTYDLETKGAWASCSYRLAVQAL